MTVEKIKPYLHHIQFPNQHDMSVCMLRFQEYYESPEFKGKFFTLDEFKPWYSNKFGNGEFTYYKDWSGFNIPSEILKPFYEGKFNPLSKEEKELLNKFTDVEGDFYIIATFENYQHLEETFRHEVAHAMFRFNKEYKDEIKNILNGKDFKELQKVLTEDWGYHKDVLEDETHAFILTNDILLKQHGVDIDELYGSTVEEIKKVFDKYNK